MMTKKNKIIILLSVVFGIFFATAIYIHWQLFVPLAKESSLVYFEVPEGDGLKTIAKKLQEKELIKNPLVFAYYARLANRKIQAGIYYLDPIKKPLEILRIISKGEISEKQVTIIEGWRREQIAQLLAKENLANYDDFMKATEKLEGRLFPDTYRFSVKPTINDIVKKMTENFDKRTKDLKLTASDIILASIIEREAKFDEDRPKIAGVFLNRLAAGLPLEADPTVQYAKELNKGKDYDYWQKLSVGDIGLDSAYNTYQTKGLPPTAICNPSLKSLTAVKNPEKNGYYFFLNTPDGKTHYSKTREEHNKIKLEKLNLKS